jgi:hypothetical protein
MASDFQNYTTGISGNIGAFLVCSHGNTADCFLFSLNFALLGVFPNRSAYQNLYSHQNDFLF